MSKLLGYYNSIEGIIRQGGTNADLWQEVHGIEAEGGPVTQGATIFDMNEVAARARAVVQAETAFGTGEEAGVVTGEMWTWAPWATSTTAAWGTPEYQIRYQYEAISPEGDMAQLWGQTDWSGPLPQSINDILDQINQSAQAGLDIGTPPVAAALGGTNGNSLGDITAVQLLRV